jgi:hypothetical protein
MHGMTAFDAPATAFDAEKPRLLMHKHHGVRCTRPFGKAIVSVSETKTYFETLHALIFI